MKTGMLEMNTLIFKTNIGSIEEFDEVKNALSNRNKIEECTIDLDDIDKVLRILSDSLSVPEIEKEVMSMGYYCKELEE
jgi:hypothetical protein